MDREEKTEQKTRFINEGKESVGYLFRHRFSWLALGLLGGVIVSVIISKFEEIISQDIRLTFFIPIIVYMSDAVGSQTEAIFVRGLVRQRVKFSVYLLKETILGLGLGAVFGLAMGFFAGAWLQSDTIGISVGLAMFLSVAVAPILALIIPMILTKEHYDPALGAGPFATIIQDLVSLLIYFSIAALVMF